jgi:hypothetical protein
MKYIFLRVSTVVNEGFLQHLCLEKEREKNNRNEKEKRDRITDERRTKTASENETIQIGSIKNHIQLVEL